MAGSGTAPGSRLKVVLASLPRLQPIGKDTSAQIDAGLRRRHLEADFDERAYAHPTHDSMLRSSLSYPLPRDRLRLCKKTTFMKAIRISSSGSSAPKGTFGRS